MWSYSRFSPYTDLALAAALTAGGIYFFSGHFTPVRFDLERIEVRIESRQIHVTGLYRYSNSSWAPSVLTMKVPFPVDADHPEPKGFSLSQSDERGHAIAEIVPAVRGGDVSFRQVFRPRESKWVRLDYVQQTRVDTARYILTTTQAWGRPITRADFVLYLPRDLNLASSSYPLRESATEGREKFFTFSRTDFYPDRDWVFTWAPTPVESASASGRQP